VLNGANTLYVKCIDNLGTESAVTSVKFNVKLSSPITLSTTGQGKITGASNGQIIQLDKICTLTAVPAANQLFSNWSGTLSATNNPLKFSMSKDMTLTANFVANPFLPLAGTFNGLFQVTNHVTHESSGFLSLVLTKSGTYSGKVIGNGGTYSFTGRFAIDQTSQLLVIRRGLPSLLVSMQLDPATKQLIGTVTDQTWTANLTADLATFSSAHPAPGYAGKYTVRFEGADPSIYAPTGDGWATVNLLANGNATISGYLADGTIISRTLPIAMDSRLPLYIPLSTGRGAFFGWLRFDASSVTPFEWFSPAMPGGKYYPQGFQREIPTYISPYVYTKGQPVLSLASAGITLTGGNLSSNTNGVIALSANNVITSQLPLGNQLSLSLNTSNGTITGTYLEAVTGRRNALKGVVLQNRNSASGYFMGTSQSGLFQIEPQ
jgi:hypothetical protein